MIDADEHARMRKVSFNVVACCGEIKTNHVVDDRTMTLGKICHSKEIAPNCPGFPSQRSSDLIGHATDLVNPGNSGVGQAGRDICILLIATRARCGALRPSTSVEIPRHMS